MIPLPSKTTKRHSVSGRGDLHGTVIQTKNMDFSSKRGYASLARKPYVFMTETVAANFETPLAIIHDDSNIYIATSESTYSLSYLAGDFTVSELTTGEPPSNAFQTDAVFFNGGNLHVSDTTGVHELISGTWQAASITSLSSSFPHPLGVSEHQTFIAVGDGNTVKLYNTSHSLQATCTIPAEHVVEWIRWKGNLIYFGTRNIPGGKSRMYIWNGSGTSAQNSYAVDGDWIFTGLVYQSSIVVVSGLGQLLRFSGDGFVPLRTDAGEEVNFPIFYTGVPWGSSAATSNLSGKITSRGAVAKGRKIFFNIDNDLNYNQGGTPGNLSELMPSGVWVFDPEVGLYHLAGAEHLQRIKITPSAIANNELTIAAQVYETGDPVYLTAKGSLTGDILTDNIYYAIKTDSTHIKLAVTPMQAKAGVNITITGSVGNASLVFNVYESVGASVVNRGCGIDVLTAGGFPRFNGIEIVYGTDTDGATGTPVGAVMSLGMGKNVGYMITPKVQASGVTDVLEALFAKFSDLNLASQKVIIKYRTSVRWGLPGRRAFGFTGGTWVDSTSFTINPKTYDFYAAAEGDEIEFIEHNGAGYLRHITLITVDSATQWTITLDEALPDITASDRATFIVQNWTKYKTISTTDDAKAAAKGLKRMATSKLMKNAKFFQFKIELRGYHDIDDSIDFEELMLVNSADQDYE